MIEFIINNFPIIKMYTIGVAPISVNDWWKPIINWKTKKPFMVVTNEGRKFKKDVQSFLAKPMLAGRLGMAVKFYVSNARMDLDNPVKPLKDALQGYTYKDDNQVKFSCEEIFVDAKNPRIEFAVWGLDEVKEENKDA